MQISVNGEPAEVPQPLSVEALLIHLGIRSGRVAVEINARVIKKADYPSQPLSPGDAVEIVAFVGGG